MIKVSSYVYNPLTSRSFFNEIDLDTYLTQQYTSVSTRLQFEYLKCQQLGGLCYFVTFTYNDNSIVHVDGLNYCFNDDIRDFCNKSKFSSSLSEHGYSFKFAFFGESGDGKGVRGKDNNPHYHALFFLYKLSECDSYYDDEDLFLKLCLESWNQDSDCSSKNYKSLNRGNVSFSSKGARVLDSKVFSYCSMYCIKQSVDNGYTKRFISYFRRVVFCSLYKFAYGNIDSRYERYVLDDALMLRLASSFCKMHKSKLSCLCGFDSSDDYVQTLHFAIKEAFASVFESYGIIYHFDFSYIFNTDVFASRLFLNFCDTQLFDAFYKFCVRRFKLTYRLSPNLGINGLEYVDKHFMLDVSMMPSFNAQRINLPSYYYRKYFFDVKSIGDARYVYIRNGHFVEYVKYNLSHEKFNSRVASLSSNYASFCQYLKSLYPQYLESFLSIPLNVFVAFKSFRGLCFAVNDFPIIDESYPCDYLIGLDYTSHEVYSLPVGEDYFTKDNEFKDFSLHPFFNYSDIYVLTFIYDKFLYKTSTRVSDIMEFFNLKYESTYEIV